MSVAELFADTLKTAGNTELKLAGWLGFTKRHPLL